MKNTEQKLVELTFQIVSSDLNMRDRMENLIDEMLDGRILLDEAVSEFQKLYIQKALERNADHISKTAATLGIHRNTLSKRVNGHAKPSKSAKQKNVRRPKSKRG